MTRKHYYLLALSSFFALFSLLMAWYTILAPSQIFPTALLLIISIPPLLLPLRGFLKGDLKSCTWLCYISLIYFTHGAVEAYANPAERSYALAELLLSFLLCLGAGMYVFKTEK